MRDLESATAQNRNGVAHRSPAQVLQEPGKFEDVRTLCMLSMSKTPTLGPEPPNFSLSLMRSIPYLTVEERNTLQITIIRITKTVSSILCLLANLSMARAPTCHGKARDPPPGFRRLQIQEVRSETIGTLGG